MRIKVNREACVGHARCAALAPDLFPLDDDGYIATDGFDVGPGNEQRDRRAALACPERAIQAEDGP
jgi:ferredoxin